MPITPQSHCYHALEDMFILSRSLLLDYPERFFDSRQRSKRRAYRFGPTSGLVQLSGQIKRPRGEVSSLATDGR